MAATTEETFPRAGHPGAGNIYLRLPVYAGATEKAALAEPLDSITFCFSRQADLQQAAVGRIGTGPAERRQARVERNASGLIPAEQVKRSLAILTQQVMPAFK
jgi:hypothetical protein